MSFDCAPDCRDCFFTHPGVVETFVIWRMWLRLLRNCSLATSWPTGKTRFHRLSPYDVIALDRDEDSSTNRTPCIVWHGCPACDGLLLACLLPKQKNSIRWEFLLDCEQLNRVSRKGGINFLLSIVIQTQVLEETLVSQNMQNVFRHCAIAINTPEIPLEQFVSLQSM